MQGRPDDLLGSRNDRGIKKVVAWVEWRSPVRHRGPEAIL